MLTVVVEPKSSEIESRRNSDRGVSIGPKAGSSMFVMVRDEFLSA